MRVKEEKERMFLVPNVRSVQFLWSSGRDCVGGSGLISCCDQGLWLDHSPSSCLHARQRLAQAVGSFSEAFFPGTLVGIQTIDKVVVFLVPPSDQPHSPLPDMRKLFQNKIQQIYLLGKIRKIKEVAILLTLPVHVHFVCNSGAKFQTNAEKVNTANGFVSGGIQGAKLEIGSLLSVCVPGFHLL